MKEEKKETRAKEIVSKGLILQEGRMFKISDPSPQRKKKFYEVTKNEEGVLKCNCFEAEVLTNESFECEHIIAVKYLEELATNQEQNQVSSENITEIDFPKKLELLRQEVSPNLIKQKEGWKDREGQAHYVDYVEWHTVADILDEKAPNWSHSIRDIKKIGNFVVVTVAITIDSVTREGIGTGIADSEVGIKKAEHDALKRAAAKFGIARHLYKKEADASDSPIKLSVNPLARSVGDLITSKQLSMIYALGREIGVDVEQECQSVFGCSLDEISKRTASTFINYLQEFKKKLSEPSVENLRKAV
ncbi:MAG: RAD52 family DNA repair protein [Pyrinomonadaceae bacterium]|nr:RAD52 family DNA repair protein [Pyrinomonadaceae bacterium]MCX7639694.1 RAD52 family DNA repair protein [Pyrinomonadaceae bacterium]MDW8304596.1 Rad52/Rad22 family DNA repair protein [Acidobacteriota bacterium]